MEVYNKNGADIQADSIEIGKNVTFGKVKVRLKGKFSIGDFSHLGDADIKGNNVSFGKHLYCSGGLRVGGGGYQNPTANLTIGDRCTIHNNFINICKPVTIGNDVGLSHDVAILTHGYWLSVLEGYPATFAGVKVGDGVIVGYRSVIMMGVEIADECVIGAQSVVAKSLPFRGIYAGSPAKFIKDIVPSVDDRAITIWNIMGEYITIADYHGIDIRFRMALNYPEIIIDGFTINVETFEYSGEESETTDDFRDFIRKYGIRIYTERPFRSKYNI